MIPFNDLISRADSAWLQERIGQDTLKVLQALDATHERASTIRQVFRALHDPRQLLQDATFRPCLFELLRPVEADALAHALDLSGESYAALNQARITRGSAAFDLCCAFFGLPEAVPEEHTPSLPTTTVTARYVCSPINSVPSCLHGVR